MIEYDKTLEQLHMTVNNVTILIEIEDNQQTEFITTTLQFTLKLFCWLLKSALFLIAFNFDRMAAISNDTSVARKRTLLFTFSVSFYYEFDMACQNEFSIVLNRLYSNIQSEDRKKRNQALLGLYDEIFVKNDCNDSVKLNVIFEDIQNNVWKSLYDKSENVRDSCISLLNEFVNRLKPNEKFPGELIPILLWRLGEKKVNEPSEEIRLRLINLLNLVILKFTQHCAAFTEDIVQILSKTLVDSYSKVRQESCICASNLARTVPRHFYDQSHKLIKPVLASFNHQHFRMRVAAIEALGNIVRWGSTKNLPTQEVFGSLAERLFDSILNVRISVTRVIADWLVNLHDRYSFFTKMIPLMLTSLCDESHELRELAWELWSKAGLQYEQENEQELKDKMDFLSEKPDHYPPNVRRPCLGCRTLVQRNTCQITPALSRELEDWKNDIRIKSAQLLCWLVLHAETDITQHTENLLLTMYKVCNQTDIRVVENVEKAAEYIAYFVPPEVYMKLVIPVIQDVCTTGHLCILAALIRGSKSDLLSAHIINIGDLLSSDNICRVRKSEYQYQLLKCCDALLSVGKEECRKLAGNLFLVLVTVKALSQKPLTDYSQELMEKLCQVTERDTTIDLYKDYTDCILKKMHSTVETWTSVSCDRFILQLILDESGPAVGLYLSHINALLKSAMKAEGDPLVRSKFFVLMSSVLARRHTIMSMTSEDAFHKFIASFILDVICPNLVWQCGRTAEALRTVVVACLCSAVLSPKACAILFEDIMLLPEDASSDDCSLQYLDRETFEEIFKTVFPLLLNSLEDCAVKTRFFSLKSLQSLVMLSSKKNILTPDHVNQSYPLVLKRLDDVSNDVRTSAVQYLVIMYSNLPSSYNPVAFQPHLESVFNTLLIHLDDPDGKFQKCMTDVLKTVGKVDRQFLYDKLDSIKNRFRNFTMCNEILDYLKTEDAH